ncbi:cytochrome c oxidase subunit II [Wenyingzhuangia sp. 2_MG-2023]|uniref:cytochrome c oxidase subunit II n=1 Tax=Wenyingzhuangia sp. 2_MG-2023 TaxID=3062639 RepID=UPI0026E475AB|nr:cytochrome c oxidase subunit II [Wenyingzhuangia sp. 2_MG-2023]MDO6738065.1 cytochrome c oxidase subunit II [Wenyingzhuangia sp. 2_MG-2023]MDO6802581.1 cytochrome c oxidase subunit II [Wenyingzhuangia sp. 1_MG-2023]
MLALFYFFVAVAIAIGIWQVNKLLTYRVIFKEIKDGKKIITFENDDNPIATDKDNDLQGKLLLVFLIGFYLLMGYCLIFLHDIMLPGSASVEGEDYDNLYTITFVLIGVVQFITQGLLYFFGYKYKGVVGKKATFFADSHKLELIWTTIPTVVLAVLILYGLSIWNDVTDLEGDEAIVVEVYAKQFAWEARYAGRDNELGRGNVRNIEGANTMGIDLTDANSVDDIPVRELHLPVGKKVVFKFRSQDVLHSAYMPHFTAQMNCVPGMVTEFGFTPKYTTEEMRERKDVIRKVASVNKVRQAKGDDPYEFDYLLLCNKICGPSHYNMQMKIVVESEKDYLIWLNQQKTAKELFKL